MAVELDENGVPAAQVETDEGLTIEPEAVEEVEEPERTDDPPPPTDGTTLFEWPLPQLNLARPRFVP